MQGTLALLKHVWNIHRTLCSVLGFLILFEGRQNNAMCSPLVSSVESFKHVFLPPRSFLISTSSKRTGWPCQGHTQNTLLVLILQWLLELAWMHVWNLQSIDYFFVIWETWSPACLCSKAVQPSGQGPVLWPHTEFEVQSNPDMHQGLVRPLGRQSFCFKR